MPIKPTVVTVKMEIPPDTYSIANINKQVTAMLEGLKLSGWGIRSWAVTK